MFWERFWIAWLAICVLMIAAGGFLPPPKQVGTAALRIMGVVIGGVGYVAGFVGYIIAHGAKPPSWPW